MNKRYHIYIAVAMTLLLALSCAKVEVPDGLRSEPYSYPVNLNVFPEALSRISVNGTSMKWEEDDRLEITAIAEDTVAVSELEVYSIDEQDSGKASFTGYVSMLKEPQSCVFTYPSGNATEVDTNGVVWMHYNSQTGSHRPFLYAKAAYDKDGITAVMQHAGAVLEIDLSQRLRDAGVAQLSFVGNRLESLSPLRIDPESGQTGFSSQAGTQITVPVQENGRTYIFVPPIRLEKGFSIICTSADKQTSMIRTFSTDGSYGSGYDFSNKKGFIIPISLDGDFINYSMQCSAPYVSHDVKSGLLHGTNVSFSMTKQGTSNKLIEEWGAELRSADRTLVRSASYMNSDEKLGEVVTMAVESDLPLLRGGNYKFKPYYVIYGTKVWLDSTDVDIPDPGVRISLTGTTTYDDYNDGNSATDPNVYANRLKIRGVSASINVHPDILSSFEASLPGDGTADNPDVSKSEAAGSNILSFGDLTRTKWTKYTFSASAKIGSWQIPAVTKDFHITGLPYEADFSGNNGNPNSWNPAWTLISANFTEKRVQFKNSGASALRSPAFYVPDEKIKVRTACNIRYNVTKKYTYAKIPFDIYITECSSKENSAITSNTEVLSISTDYYQSVMDIDQFDKKGYMFCDKGFELNASEPCLIYSANITNTGMASIYGNLAVSFGHKIEYK